MGVRVVEPSATLDMETDYKLDNQLQHTTMHKFKSVCDADLLKQKKIRVRMSTLHDHLTRVVVRFVCLVVIWNMVS